MMTTVFVVAVAAVWTAIIRKRQSPIDTAFRVQRGRRRDRRRYLHCLLRRCCYKYD